MELIVVDLEATCWDTSRPRSHMEIIEIGAVRLDASLTIVDEFDSFVRPVVDPKLSQFCTALTTIMQTDVNGAEMFPAVFARFLEWIGTGPYRLCSWGFFDVGQFRLDCTRFGLVFPEQFESDHLNIKQTFAEWKGVRRCGMTAALDLLGLPLAGTHHRGIDDARNIATIVQQTLPNVVVASPRPPLPDRLPAARLAMPWSTAGGLEPAPDRPGRSVPRTDRATLAP